MSRAPVIVTVTLNAALDTTYLVPQLELGAAHRVQEIHRQAGGKGINVSRGLACMGVASVATGLLGGEVGARIRQELADLGIQEDFVVAPGESRQTVVAVARDGTFLELDEPGMHVPGEDWDRFVAGFSARVAERSIVVLSGSLPRSVPTDAYRTLTALARRRGARVVLDASGTAFAEALQAGPDVVKPNEAELALFAGEPCRTTDAVISACARLLEAGAGAVAASRGVRGAVAVSPDGAWAFSHGSRQGNPVGAGDALTAGLAAGLAEGRRFADCARQGVTWAFASLASRWAGEIDPSEVAACERAVSSTPT